jgi:hypothetical protein
MSDRDVVLSNVQEKLDDLGIQFAASPTTVGSCLNDTLRELRISDITAVDDPVAELQIENRTLWWYLKRKRIGLSTSFKYSTGGDAEQVDKTMVPKMIGTVMHDIDLEFKKWRKASCKNGIWVRDVVASDTLAGM